MYLCKDFLDMVKMLFLWVVKCGPQWREMPETIV